jgi:hypothetical protein
MSRRIGSSGFRLICRYSRLMSTGGRKLFSRRKKRRTCLIRKVAPPHQKLKRAASVRLIPPEMPLAVYLLSTPRNHQPRLIPHRQKQRNPYLTPNSIKTPSSLPRTPRHLSDLIISPLDSAKIVSCLYRMIRIQRRCSSSCML